MRTFRRKTGVVDLILYPDKYEYWDWKDADKMYVDTSKGKERNALFFHSPGVHLNTLEKFLANLSIIPNFLILSNGFGDLNKTLPGQLPWPHDISATLSRIEIIECKSEHVKDHWNKRIDSRLYGVAFMHATC